MFVKKYGKCQEIPKYDEEKTIDKTIEIPVQINGKTKAVLSIAADEAKESVLARAKEVLGNRITGTIVKEKKIGRNDKCPCGSGNKYKFCCGRQYYIKYQLNQIT